MADTFDSLGLNPLLLKAIKQQGYENPTPIQNQAIPPLLEGRDVLGCAQTGTGKTAAFSLPILHHLAKKEARGKRLIRGLILSPTRELAAQIAENIGLYSDYLDIRHLCIFGGVSQRPQVKELRRGVDVLVATPGRLLDLHGQGLLDMSRVEFVVLDEADRMLDMGFIHDMRRVFKALPPARQSLLFSATMPDPIAKLAAEFLTNPIRVEVDRESTTVKKIHQSVMFVERANKKTLLKELLKDPEVESAIVFTRTKHGANRVAHILTRAGISAAAIHGNKSQGARQRALAGFKAGEIKALIATDIASRGIDVDGVSHVFNYELPNISESYVHRIGRTGRAGRDGIAIAFCDDTETAYLVDIQKMIGQSLAVIDDHGYHFPEAIPDPTKKPVKPPRRQGRSHQNRNQRPAQNRTDGGTQSGRRRQKSRKSDSSESRSTGDTDKTTSSTPKKGSDQSSKSGDENKRRRRRRRRGPRKGPSPTQPKQDRDRQNRGRPSSSGKPAGDGTSR